MASRKDMRRSDLVIPFQEPPPKTETAGDFASAINSALPMAALMMRNKFVGWAAIVLSIQNWLGQSQDAKRAATTPAYVPVLMSVVSLIVTYMPLFMPPPNQLGKGTGTEAPAPAPPL
jgi:hypothetical protein